MSEKNKLGVTDWIRLVSIGLSILKLGGGLKRTPWFVILILPLLELQILVGILLLTMCILFDVTYIFKLYFIINSLILIIWALKAIIFNRNFKFSFVYSDIKEIFIRPQSFISSVNNKIKKIK